MSENSNSLVQSILDKIYATYGTDSGILFGIKNKWVVETIIEFTIKEIGKTTTAIEETFPYTEEDLANDLY